MDSVYPEPLSRLHKRTVRKRIHGNTARFKTQPVTFSEIQEVDEETSDEIAATSSKSELDLKAKFEEFKRQRDKDLKESRPISIFSGGVSFDKETSSPGFRKSGNKTVEGTCGTDPCADSLENKSTEKAINKFIAFIKALKRFNVAMWQRIFDNI